MNWKAPIRRDFDVGIRSVTQSIVPLCNMFEFAYHEWEIQLDLLGLEKSTSVICLTCPRRPLYSVQSNLKRPETD